MSSLSSVDADEEVLEGSGAFGFGTATTTSPSSTGRNTSARTTSPAESLTSWESVRPSAPVTTSRYCPNGTCSNAKCPSASVVCSSTCRSPRAKSFTFAAATGSPEYSRTTPSMRPRLAPSAIPGVSASRSMTIFDLESMSALPLLESQGGRACDLEGTHRPTSTRGEYGPVGHARLSHGRTHRVPKNGAGVSGRARDQRYAGGDCLGARRRRVLDGRAHGSPSSTTV